MDTKIALLRGVNVAGKHKVPMAELRTLLTNTGLFEVKTYIQTGNIFFKSLETNNNKLEEKISKAIKDHFGFKVPVLVKSSKEIQAIFDNCPFSEEKKINSYFVMLSKLPNVDLVRKASQKTYKDEEYLIYNNSIYFYSANGYGRAKFDLNFFERKLNVKATARNYKTMVKLLSLSQTTY